MHKKWLYTAGGHSLQWSLKAGTICINVHVKIMEFIVVLKDGSFAITILKHQYISNVLILERIIIIISSNGSRSGSSFF